MSHSPHTDRPGSRGLPALGVEAVLGGERWRVDWFPGESEPGWAGHGSLGICVTSAGIVLVSQDGEAWEFPAGRPEPGESPRAVLVREVAEEACCTVLGATYLGTTVGRCLSGPETGLALERTHWRAQVRLDPWEPRHETTARQTVAASEVLGRLAAPTEMLPLYRAILEAGAKHPRGPSIPA